MSTKKTTKRSGLKLGDMTARAMILAGAGKVFTLHGVREPNVEAILQEANVSRRTFYRLYSGKEDVMKSLYEFGVERLISVCRTALASTSELSLADRFEVCIDAHLRNAREFGRLVYVLGGAAQHQDSLLYPRRVEAHDELTRLIGEAHPAADDVLIRGVLLALEGVTRLMLERGDQGRAVSNKDYLHVRAIMHHIARASLETEFKAVAEVE